jgi:hypothetical protein
MESDGNFVPWIGAASITPTTHVVKQSRHFHLNPINFNSDVLLLGLAEVWYGATIVLCTLAGAALGPRPLRCEETCQAGFTSA